MIAYACYDVAMTHKQDYLSWVSPSGAKWPAKDEFEVGCTYEHRFFSMAVLFFEMQILSAFAV